MQDLLWIAGSGLFMCAVALVGALTLLLGERTLQRLMLPLVAFSAGSLLGGALLHMLPAAIEGGMAVERAALWLLGGFVWFFALEQSLHWHHCHRADMDCKQPLTYLVLIGDGVHNFLGGLAVGAAYLADVRLGVATTLAAAAHEIPQELGDFGVLLHGGWTRGRALLWNLLSASTFLLGGLLAWGASLRFDLAFLLPLAAGNFVYIAASDLVPEVNRHHGLGRNALHLASFAGGIVLLWTLRTVFHHAVA